MKRDLVARLVKKVSEEDEMLSKHEYQGMELKRIKYMTDYDFYFHYFCYNLYGSCCCFMESSYWIPARNSFVDI
jgi:hypothetical protein